MEVKPEINVVKIKRGDWRVRFNIDNQYFTLLCYENTKKEAEWTARMLKLAFNKTTPPETG